MELSADVLDGLQICGDCALISDKCYKTFVQKTVSSILEKNNRNPLAEPPLSSLDHGVAKQAHFSLITLYLEAAKHDQDAASFSHILEDCKFGADRIKIVSEVYLVSETLASYQLLVEQAKPHLRILLSSTSHNPPHIVDADWRLDYLIKNNHLEQVRQPTYMISLKTEECANPETQSVEFACSQEQLQDMVGKLKDACKSVERAAQM